MAQVRLINICNTNVFKYVIVSLVFLLLSYMAYHFRLLNSFHVCRINKVLSCIWSKTGSSIRSVMGKKTTFLVESFVFRNVWWRTTFLVLWWVSCRTDISLYCLVCSNSVSLLCPCRVRYPTSLYLALEGESEPWLGCWAPCPRWGNRGFWTLPSTWVVSLDQHGRSGHPILWKTRSSYFFY